jgi:hypothetical protein
MGEIIFWIFIVILAGVSTQTIKTDITKEGRELQRKFNSLGNMSGKSLDEIVKVCGHWNSIHYGVGYILCQWHKTGYWISIQFDNDKKFKTITSEHINN